MAEDRCQATFQGVPCQWTMAEHRIQGHTTTDERGAYYWSPYQSDDVSKDQFVTTDG